MKKKAAAGGARRASSARGPRERPNRIFELMKARNWTYAEVAERVRALAEAKNDDDRKKVHEVTINRLALGKTTLSQDWMELLGEIYQVSPSEIISHPIAGNLRRVTVRHSLQAHAWRTPGEMAGDAQFDVMIPDDEALRGMTLYAGRISGPAVNLRYSPGSIIILSKLQQRPGEIVAGKRYHVQTTRLSDGKIEHTIKMLVEDENRKFWLKPESDHPEHQEWMPLEGKDGLRVELIGRVRGVYFRED